MKLFTAFFAWLFIRLKVCKHSHCTWKVNNLKWHKYFFYFYYLCNYKVIISLTLNCIQTERSQLKKERKKGRKMAIKETVSQFSCLPKWKSICADRWNYGDCKSCKKYVWWMTQFLQFVLLFFSSPHQWLLCVMWFLSADTSG